MTCQLMGDKSVDPLPQCGELQKAKGRRAGSMGSMWIYGRYSRIYMGLYVFICLLWDL